MEKQTLKGWQEYQKICKHKWYFPYVNQKEMRCSMCDKSIETAEEARQYAIDWQNWASEQNLSYSELAEWQAIFCELSEKFNLEDEFKENGII